MRMPWMECEDGPALLYVTLSQPDDDLQHALDNAETSTVRIFRQVSNFRRLLILSISKWRVQNSPYNTTKSYIAVAMFRPALGLLSMPRYLDCGRLQDLVCPARLLCCSMSMLSSPLRFCMCLVKYNLVTVVIISRA